MLIRSIMQNATSLRPIYCISTIIPIIVLNISGFTMETRWLAILVDYFAPITFDQVSSSIKTHSPTNRVIILISRKNDVLLIFIDDTSMHRCIMKYNYVVKNRCSFHILYTCLECEWCKLLSHNSHAALRQAMHDYVILLLAQRSRWVLNRTQFPPLYVFWHRCFSKNPKTVR